MVRTQALFILPGGTKKMHFQKDPEMQCMENEDSLLVVAKPGFIPVLLRNIQVFLLRLRVMW